IEGTDETGCRMHLRVVGGILERVDVRGLCSGGRHDQTERSGRRKKAHQFLLSRRARKARRSNRCTSCSFLSSAPCSGGMSLVGSFSFSASGGISSFRRSFSQSSSSLVEGFFLRPGTSRIW